MVEVKAKLKVEFYLELPVLKRVKGLHGASGGHDWALNTDYQLDHYVLCVDAETGEAVAEELEQAATAIREKLVLVRQSREL